MSYFTYIHARPDTKDVSGVFYVGKGTKARATKIIGCKRNKYYLNVANKCGVDRVLIGLIECSTEENAFLLEKGLIRLMRNQGVRLTNQMEGGRGGASGHVFTEEQRRKLSEIRKGKTLSAETKAKISVVSKRTTEKFWAINENREKAAERMRARFARPGEKQKASDRMKLMWSDPLKRKAMLDARRNK